MLVYVAHLIKKEHFPFNSEHFLINSDHFLINQQAFSMNFTRILKQISEHFLINSQAFFDQSAINYKK